MHPEHMTEDELLLAAELRNDPWLTALLKVVGMREKEIEELREEINTIEMEEEG